MSVPERIVQSTLLQAIARVAMALTLPLLLMGAGYIGAMGNTIAAHSTDIALLQQQAVETTRRLEMAERRQDQILDALSKVSSDLNTVRLDAQYTREWVKEVRERERRP